MLVSLPSASLLAPGAQMKQEMNRACEDHEHAMARYLQLRRNSEEGITQVRPRPLETMRSPAEDGHGA